MFGTAPIPVQQPPASGTSPLGTVCFGDRLTFQAGLFRLSLMLLQSGLRMPVGSQDVMLGGSACRASWSGGRDYEELGLPSCGVLGGGPCWDRIIPLCYSYNQAPRAKSTHHARQKAKKILQALNSKPCPCPEAAPNMLQQRRRVNQCSLDQPLTAATRPP